MSIEERIKMLQDKAIHNFGLEDKRTIHTFRAIEYAQRDGVMTEFILILATMWLNEEISCANADDTDGAKWIRESSRLSAESTLLRFTNFEIYEW